MAEIGIFVGTMYGNSLLVAEEAEAGGQAEADGSTTKQRYLKILN